MKARYLAFVLIVSLLFVVCVGCKIAVTMPHSSDEYKNGEWTSDELVEHFKELGFTDIKVEEYTTYDKGKAKLQVLVAEDSASWLPAYRDFEKGETVDTLRTVIIRETKLIPVITVENNEEFASFVQNGLESSQNTTDWKTFLKEHHGEALEFDGTITYWPDEYWYIGTMSLSVAVEDSSNTIFSWNSFYMHELGLTGKYHYEKYTTGLISVGMRVHIIAIIDSSADGWTLKIDEIQIIE